MDSLDLLPILIDESSEDIIEEQSKPSASLNDSIRFQEDQTQYIKKCPCSNTRCKDAWSITEKYGVFEKNIILRAFFVRNLTTQFFNLVLPIELSYYILDFLLQIYISEKDIHKRRITIRDLCISLRIRVLYYTICHCNNCHTLFWEGTNCYYCTTCKMDFCRDCEKEMIEIYRGQYCCNTCYNRQCFICGCKLEGQEYVCRGCKCKGCMDCLDLHTSGYLACKLCINTNKKFF